MAFVSVPKDLTKIKNKVAFNLTQRQIIGLVSAGAVSIPVYLFTKEYLGSDLGVMLLIITALPFLFITFYEKDGLSAEKYIKYILLHSFINPKIRVYKVKSIYDLKRMEVRSEKNKKREARG